MVTSYAEIQSETENKNYYVFLELKDFLLRLFVLFGTNVRINIPKTKIDVKENTNEILIISSIPNKEVTSTDILKYSKLLKNSGYNNENDGLFYNLVLANEDSDIIHRFRSLFSVFDSIAPKNDRFIDYQKLKKKYREIIFDLYNFKTGNFVRYNELINEIIEIKDKMENESKNFERLNDARNRLFSKKIISNEMAFYLLKSIQIIRNHLTHGNFEKISIKSIKSSYELLLPLTKELMKKKIIK